MTIQVNNPVRFATKLQALAAVLLQFSHYHEHSRLGRPVISARALVNRKPRCDRRSLLFPLRRVSMHDGHKGDDADSNEREEETPNLDMREHGSGMIDVLDARSSDDRDQAKEGTVIQMDFPDDEDADEGTVILEISDSEEEGSDTDGNLKVIERLTEIIKVLNEGRSNRTAGTTRKGVVTPETLENSSSISLGKKNGRKMIIIRSGEGDEDSGGAGSGVLSKLLGATFGLAEEIEEEDEDTAYSDPIRNFDLKPKEIVDHLNRYVIRQDDAKKVLAVAISDHYNHCRRYIDTPVLEQPTNYAKPNILLVGPTGVGKTYLMKTIAKLIGVPFVKADATKFSETGIVGKDVDDLVRDLVDSAGGNVTAAQFGIVYIDEVDKIASGNNPDMSVRTSGIGHGVQNNLLKLLEDTDVSLVSDMRSQMSGLFSGDRGDGESINTRNILFIFSGAFTTLDSEIRRRKETKSMGFTFDKSQSEELGQTASYLRFAETADFVSSGLEAEFVGRVPVRVALNALDEHDLKEILTNAEDNVLSQFIRDFEGHNISMLPTDEALTQVARLAAKEKTGARGLVTVLERVLREHKYELPSSSIKTFELDNATVVSPAVSLKGILSSQTVEDILNTQRRDVKRWEQNIGHQVGGNIRPVLDDGAFEEFVDIAHAKNVSIYSAIVQQFQKIAVRLPLYLTSHANRTNQTELWLDRNFVRHPEEGLAALEKVVEGELEKVGLE